MKQFNFLMLAGALCFTACADHPEFSLGGGVELSDNQISFSTNTVNGWQGLGGGSRAAVAVGENAPLKMESSLGHALYLHPIEQAGTYIYNSKDELITRSGVPLPSDGNLLANDNDAKTRGSKYNDTGWSAAFGVSAILTNQNISSSYFQNLKATPNGGSWVTSEAKYWPTDGSLSFYAYAPYCDNSHQMLSEKAAVDVANAKTVHYVALANDVEHQPDLIVANQPNVTHGSTEDPNSVSLNFSHVLTAITFAVGSDMVPGTVKSIAIKGVKNEGDFDLAANTWNAASLQGNADFVIPLGNNGQGLVVKGQQDEALTTGAQTLMMIPQTFDANSTAKVEIVFTKDGTDHTLSAPLRNTQWDAGSTIIYKVSTSSLQPVLTTVNATFPTDWSGHTEYANKLKSAYAKDDKLGLYVISQEGKVKAANVEVTFNGTSWTLANQTIRFNANDHFFAYSPYKDSADPLLKDLPTVSTAVTVDKLASSHAFFKSLEDAWSIQSDQSTRANFDASDLLVSKDAHSNNTGSGIDIVMDHAMGLADITLGQGLNYELSDKKYSWTSAIVSDKFVDKKPYGISYNRYVAVVKPNVSTTFNAIASGWKCAWKSPLLFNLTASASIEKQTASRTDGDNHSYTLALGDIYYTNGAVTHQSDDLEPAGANTPIGLVGYIAQGGDDYWVEKNTGSGHGGHALVMCKYTVGSTSYTNIGAIYSSGPNTNWGRFKVNTSELIMNSGNQSYGSGYIETDAVIAKIGASYATGAAKGYTTLVAPKDKSTGWFLPSAGQYYAVLSHLGGKFPDSWKLDVYMPANYSFEIPAHVNEMFKKAFSTNYTRFLNGIGGVEATSSECSAMEMVSIDNGAADETTPHGDGSFRFYGADNGRYYYKSANSQIARPFLAF